jgi:preprotein translocase subunit SecA
MDDLKEGIGLRAYGQRDPLIEYKSEAYELFMNMLNSIRDESLKLVFKWFPEIPEQLQRRRRAPERITTIHQSVDGLHIAKEKEAVHSSPSQAGKPQPVRVGEKIGRNDPCPCGSGKKYKHCCGR